MKRTVTISALIFLIISCAYGQDPKPSDGRRINIKLYELWDHLKEHLDGDNWIHKDLNTLYDATKDDTTATPRLEREDYYGTTMQMEIDISVQRRPFSFVVFDLSNNGLKGKILNDSIWTWEKDNVAWTDIGTRFYYKTDFLFSYNEIDEITAPLTMGNAGNFFGCGKLYLDHNNLTRFEPIAYSTKKGAKYFNGALDIRLNNNYLYDVPETWKTQSCDQNIQIISANATVFRIENNLLNFKHLIDINNNIHHKIPEKYWKEGFEPVYGPQRPLGDSVDEQTYNQGQQVNLNFSLSHSKNDYIWELNGEEVPLSDSKNYAFTLSPESAGVYRCKVTNQELPGIELYSKDMAVFMNKNGNQSVNDFNLSNAKALAFAPQWSIIGDFFGDDPDGDELYYRLTDCEGDNACFRIQDGATLVSSTILFEHSFKTEYNITVEAYDIYGGKCQKSFSITIGESSEPTPKGMNLSNNTIEEGKIAKVGEFSLIGVETSDYTFELPNYKDNQYFRLEGNKLYTKIALNYELQREYKIRVKASKGEIFTTKNYIVLTTDTNDAPGNIAITEDEIEINQSAGKYLGTIVATDDDDEDVFFNYKLSENEFFVLKDKDKLYTKRRFTVNDIGKAPLNIEVESYGVKLYNKKLKYHRHKKKELSLEIDIVPVQNVENMIYLENSNIEENYKGLVGKLKHGDGKIRSYELISGEGSESNNHFEIKGDELFLKEALDHETSSTVRVRVKSEETITILSLYVSNINEAPTVIGLTNFIVIPDWGVGTEIATIVLGDEDTGKGLFTLGSDGDNSYFTIDQNILKLNK